MTVLPNRRGDRSAQAALEDGESDYRASSEMWLSRNIRSAFGCSGPGSAQKHREQVDVRSCPTPELLIRFDRVPAHQRERWTKADVLAVGIVGLLGTLASVFDDALDAQIQSGLALLNETDSVHGWVQARRNLSIDYTGRNFG